MILAIYGAGGLGREVYDTAIVQHNPEWDNIVFVDDFNHDRQISGVDVISFPKLVEKIGIGNLKVIIGIGEPSIRAMISDRIKNVYNVYSDTHATIIHPTAIISPSSKIGAGVYIGPFAFVSSDVILNDNVFIQPHALVGHDTQIGSFSVISPNVTVAGSCRIGERTYIGMNACIEQGRSIGDDVIIGMSSCVNNDIPSEVIALGFPARIVKKNENKKVFKN